MVRANLESARVAARLVTANDHCNLRDGVTSIANTYHPCICITIVYRTTAMTLSEPITFVIPRTSSFTRTPDLRSRIVRWPVNAVFVVSVRASYKIHTILPVCRSLMIQCIIRSLSPARRGKARLRAPSPNRYLVRVQSRARNCYSTNSNLGNPHKPYARA